jgi:dUTP pyrophosphatase
MMISIQRVHPSAVLPEYTHGPAEDAGMDLRSVEEATLEPGVPKLVRTGLMVELPPGYEGQVRPRSGLALKHAITIPNAPGTIDPGYRGEIQVILLNLGREPYAVTPGDRIAQLVVSRYESVTWDERPVSGSNRGAGGFGSSGR